MNPAAWLGQGKTSGTDLQVDECTVTATARATTPPKDLTLSLFLFSQSLRDAVDSRVENMRINLRGTECDIPSSSNGLGWNSARAVVAGTVWGGSLEVPVGCGTYRRLCERPRL